MTPGPGRYTTVYDATIVGDLSLDPDLPKAIVPALAPTIVEFLKQ